MSSFDLDAKFVRTMAKLLEESGLTEMEYSEGERRIRLSRGDTVKAGQTILIIEAMKVMNPIKAAKGGTVTQILVANAQPVEFGQPLLISE